MKHAQTLSRERTGLVVIDMQEKFGPVIPRFDEVVTNTVKLILTFQMFKMPVVVTEQYPKGLGNTVEKIRRQFTLLEVVEKLEFSCAANSRFMAVLNPLGLKTVVLCGVETHVCVNQTALELLQRGFNVHVVADAVGSRFELDHSTALRKMDRAGVVIDTTEMALFELCERAGTESFRNIQRMVKAAPKPAAAVAAGPAAPRPAAAATPPQLPPAARPAPLTKETPAAPAPRMREAPASVPDEVFEPVAAAQPAAPPPPDQGVGVQASAPAVEPQLDEPPATVNVKLAPEEDTHTFDLEKDLAGIAPDEAPAEGGPTEADLADLDALLDEGKK